MTFSPNQLAIDELGRSSSAGSDRSLHQIGGAEVIDFGVSLPGSLSGGIALAQACLGGLGRVSLVPSDFSIFGSANAVFVRTDSPLLACLGCQYAGWPVQSDDFFAMGSGPMRLLRGKEPVLIKLGLSDATSDRVCGVLEADKLPTPSAIAHLASECGVEPEAIVVGIASSTSIAGSTQVVARSVETAMHKLDEIGFDVRKVVSATGVAPLPPPAKQGDTIGGIGRTNDAMLYGATTTLWVDCDDDEIEAVLEHVPSSSSKDHGRPFAKIFADYNHDFYQVDPGLFSPAVVHLHNLRSGRTHSRGHIESKILRESFGA